MMRLFDEEQIMKSFIRSEKHDEARETAERMIKLESCHLISNSIRAYRNRNSICSVFYNEVYAVISVISSP